ncbi:MAG: response regulator [Anaerolineales bacterium]
MSILDSMQDWVVLIVDDEPDNVQVVEKILTYNGAQIYTADDGHLGLAILESITPTFVLLDLSMPNMDGWEMLARMREQPQLDDVPVIALTAHAMPSDEEAVMAAGFDGYISKPFRLDNLLEKIKHFLEQALESRS